MAIENRFDVAFVTDQARREKQIQQNYRPVIGVHKWFARRPGTLFRALLLAEWDGEEPLARTFSKSHKIADKTIADPFMGGGTPLIEATRLGCSVIGRDINPMAYWIVRQELGHVDRGAFLKAAEEITASVEESTGRFYHTKCTECGNREADVKYFLWVKQAICPRCERNRDLFPGYLIAKNDRHTHYVIVCGSCGHLNQVLKIPTEGSRVLCQTCRKALTLEGPAARSQCTCPNCGETIAYPQPERGRPLHRMFALEYHCARCSNRHLGRYFKAPDEEDLELYEEASRHVSREQLRFVPNEEIPSGDESTRLHRWGYRHYRDLFNDRQLLGLNRLASKIGGVKLTEIRFALATVFSDFLRYQNMLVRYDTWALKALDIFSVHGYPVGLVQCESNLLGIPKVGSGGFQHFVQKYDRAKAYCEAPFETIYRGKAKYIVPIRGERILARVVSRPAPRSEVPWAWLNAADAGSIKLRPRSLDAVLTDPPYFANVQYAELMDFCYVWLRKLLKKDVRQFRPLSTRTPRELTGNKTLGRTLDHFTKGLSRVFCRYAAALKPGAPFVFTYHHNKLDAYLPIIVSVLDAGLACTASIPCPGEMSASIHINGTGSSVVDTVFVCRATKSLPSRSLDMSGFVELIRSDLSALRRGGLNPTLGDARCVLFGHLSRLAILRGLEEWECHRNVTNRLRAAEELVKDLEAAKRYDEIAKEALKLALAATNRQLTLGVAEPSETYAETAF